MNDYQKERLQEKLKIVDDLNKFSLKWEFMPYKDESWNGTINLLGCDIDICVSYHDYVKKYSFYLNKKNPYVEFYTQEEVCKTLKKPQEVGVLTEKKISDWVKYLTEAHEQLKKISEERVENVDKFLNKMKKMGVKINNGYDNRLSGEIVKNGLKFSFEIGESGYISKKIDVHYSTGNDEDTFLKLADNKFISKT